MLFSIFFSIGADRFVCLLPSFRSIIKFFVLFLSQQWRISPCLGWIDKSYGSVFICSFSLSYEFFFVNVPVAPFHLLHAPFSYPRSRVLHPLCNIRAVTHTHTNTLVLYPILFPSLALSSSRTLAQKLSFLTLFPDLPSHCLHAASTPSTLSTRRKRRHSFNL